MPLARVQSMSRSVLSELVDSGRACMLSSRGPEGPWQGRTPVRLRRADPLVRRAGPRSRMKTDTRPHGRCRAIPKDLATDWSLAGRSEELSSRPESPRLIRKWRRTMIRSPVVAYSWPSRRSSARAPKSPCGVWRAFQELAVRSARRSLLGLRRTLVDLDDPHGRSHVLRGVQGPRRDAPKSTSTTRLPRSEPFSPALESPAANAPKDPRDQPPNRTARRRRVSSLGAVPHPEGRCAARTDEPRAMPGRDDSNRPPRGFLPYDVCWTSAATCAEIASPGYGAPSGFLNLLTR